MVEDLINKYESTLTFLGVKDLINLDNRLKSITFSELNVKYS